MVRVKICGVKDAETAAAAVAAGADALGFVFAKSPRRVSPELAREIIAGLPALVGTVGLFVNEPVEEMARVREFCNLDYVQLSGDETPETARRLGGRVIKTLAVGDAPPEAEAYPGCTLLLDAHVPGLRGGTGKTFDWELAREAARRRPIILAGGLNPDNVAAAVAAVRPFAVDVSSGVEHSPGRKDHELIASFIRAAKSA